MKAIGIILLLLVWQTSFSQWTDDFSDGDFTNNPRWIGDTANYTIESNTLRLTAPAENGSSYMATASENIENASWQITVRLDFNPSSANYVKIYLVSNNSNLGGGSLEGYFVKIGNTNDEISLYRTDGLNEVEIIDGIDGRVNLSAAKISVRVTRINGGDWQLSTKLDLEQDWFIEGSAIDESYFSSAYFGVHCTYTSTRSTKIYFDDIIVRGDPYTDTFSPQVDSAYAVSDKEIAVHFNESIDPISAADVYNYTLNNQTLPTSVVVGDSSVLLVLANAAPVLNKLLIKGIEDLNHNVLIDTVLQVIYIDPQPAGLGDIVINELMADPSPREDLPEGEYIELYNTTDRAINMTGWSFSDKISESKLKNFILLPDSFLILANSSNSQLFTAYGKVMGLSPWPSLNNTGDSISLISTIGEVVDLLEYKDSWYRDPAKENGGWSLERINPRQPCSGLLNWLAATDDRGGTPGEPNSVLVTPDTLSPELLSFHVRKDSLHLIFSEPIKETIGKITSIPENPIESTVVTYNELFIKFAEPFTSGANNEITIKSVVDCLNNETTDITIGFNPDFEAPQIDSVFSNYPNVLELFFNEAIQGLTIDKVNIGSIIYPNKVEFDSSNPRHFSLYFDEILSRSETYLLKIENVQDLWSNQSPSLQYSFVYQPLRYPHFAEVLITEIMADPTPPVGLPEQEYLEITNMTSERLVLKDLFLRDEKDIVTFSTGIIEPNQRIVLTKKTAVDLFSEDLKTIGFSNWPTLNNTGDKITLLDTGQNTINHVTYTNEWYDSEEKTDGGWSLELIDETNYCQGDIVWTASTNALGGTPGAPNSTTEVLSDLKEPSVVEAFAFSKDSIIIRFSESLLNALPVVNIDNTDIFSTEYTSYDRKEIISIVESLQPRIKYELTAENIIDCAGNINHEENRIIILPEKGEQGDVVVSEVLFNPLDDGADFIEVYNTTPKYISLNKWIIRNGSSSAQINIKDILYPYSFRVLTPIPENILEIYPKAVPKNIFEQTLPVLPNSQGIVTLSDEWGGRIDSILYNEDWHFPYLERLDGVSLARIDYSAGGTIASNWVSSASVDNYATPGYTSALPFESKNSAPITADPPVIIPDGDGQDDFMTITLSMSNLGSLVTLNIYNINGRLVKELANNVLLTNKTGFTWDGTDYNGAIVSLGHYIIVSEVISSTGSTELYREKVVVASGF